MNDLESFSQIPLLHVSNPGPLHVYTSPSQLVTACQVNSPPSPLGHCGLSLLYLNSLFTISLVQPTPSHTRLNRQLQSLLSFICAFIRTQRNGGSWNPKERESKNGQQRLGKSLLFQNFLFDLHIFVFNAPYTSLACPLVLPIDDGGKHWERRGLDNKVGLQWFFLH